MSPIMKIWQDFLDSLSTKGGNIFLMFLAMFGLMVFMLHVTHHTTDVSLTSAAHDMLVGFGAALLAVLSGSSSRQQMADRVETAVTGQKVEVGKTDSVTVSNEAPKT